MAHTTKENRDIYYRKAKEEGYRARSAYKLLQIFKSYHILYPILDEESALSILLNSCCSDCEKDWVKPEYTGPFHENLDQNHRDDGSGLNFHEEGPDSDSDSSSDGDSDTELVDYFKIKRNCLRLGRVKNVIDLCSAPGSWSQLLRNLVYHDYESLKKACEKLQGSRKVCRNLVEYVNVRPAIVAIDLQQMAPLDGVHFLKGDITDPEVLDQVRQLFIDNVSKNIGEAFDGSGCEELTRNAQLITCDGAPDVSGLHETDAFLQSSLIKSALSVCFTLLETGGSFICKTFFGSEDTPVFSEVCAYFDYCTIFKPAASRPSSFEHFIVATGFRPLGFIPIRPSNSPVTNEKGMDSDIELVMKNASKILSGDLSPYDLLTS